jgi:hypothetical protein
VRFMHPGSRPGGEMPPRREHAGHPAAGPRFRYSRWAGIGALAGALVMIGSAASASTGWSVESIPQTGNNTTLIGASALSSTDAWAVGEQLGSAGQALPVSYNWNGTAWSLVATPSLSVSSSLMAVSASSPTDAWAVGFSILGRHDDGTLMEHWNGTAWSVNSSSVVTGYAAMLTSVVDLSPSNAWAVGQGATGTLLEHWNGTAWSTVTVPDPDFTPGVGETLSASSASDIWLVGTTFNLTTDATVAEALHFNGTSWSVVPMQQPGTNTPTIAAVTDLSASNAWAVGEDIGATSAVGGSALTEHWNGTSWTIVPSPTPGADPELTGVAARGSSDVYAVGSDVPSVDGGAGQAMILRWNGSAWSADPVPSGDISLFGAATVPGAANEWAVGTLSNGPVILSHS